MVSKATIARQLKVSPAYVTMISNGKRVPSKKLQKKINKLGLTNELTYLTFNQGVAGSRPLLIRVSQVRDLHGLPPTKSEAKFPHFTENPQNKAPY